MNRLSSVIAGAITTAISGATLAAAAVSQGVFDAGPSHSPHVGDAANAMAAQQTSWAPDPTAAAQAEAAQLPPRVVYVEREPIVVTREIRTVAQTAGNEATPPPSAPTSTPEPSKPTATPAEAPPPPAAAQPATPPQPPAIPPQQKPSLPAAPAMAANAATPTAPPAATPRSSDETSKRESEHEPEHESEHD